MTLYVLGGGAVKKLVQEIGDQFLAATGTGIAGKFGAVGTINEAFVAGRQCDLLILTKALIQENLACGRLVQDSVFPIGDVATGIAVPKSAPKPDLDNSDSLRAALESAAEIYVPSIIQSTAGRHFASILRRLGIFEQLQTRLREYPNGAAAMEQMGRAQGSRIIGCTQCTEIFYTETVELAGVLPHALALVTQYQAGIPNGATQPELAARFATLLIGPEYETLRQASGFGPCSGR